MKILLIGATGMVGSRILSEVLARGHTVIAAVRTPDSVPANPNVTAVAADVNDTAAITDLAKKADVIISAVSPRNTGDAFKDAVNFTTSLIAVVKATGKRLLMVGGGSSLNMPDGSSCIDTTPDFIMAEASGMRCAFGLMTLEDIDFTVLAPAGQIGPGERTGTFRLGGRTLVTTPKGEKNRISAEDFAVAMIDEMEKPAHFRTIFNVGY